APRSGRRGLTTNPSSAASGVGTPHGVPSGFIVASHRAEQKKANTTTTRRLFPQEEKPRRGRASVKAEEFWPRLGDCAAAAGREAGRRFCLGRGLRAGLVAYRQRRWEEAQQHFVAANTARGGSGHTATVFIERCRTPLSQPAWP